MREVLIFFCNPRGFISIVAVTMLMFTTQSYADDPCFETDQEVANIINSFQKFNHLISKKGAFQVRQLASESGPFELSYQVGGQSLFRHQIAYPSLALADALVIKSLQLKDGTKLGLGYGMGAGGQISCEYKVYDAGGRFLSKRGKW